VINYPSLYICIALAYVGFPLYFAGVSAKLNNGLIVIVLNALNMFIFYLFNKLYPPHCNLFYFYLFNKGINFLIRGISALCINLVNLFLLKFAFDLFLFKCLAPGALNFNRLALLGPTIFTLFNNPL